MTTLGDFLPLAFRPAGQQGATVPNDGLPDPVLSPIHFLGNRVSGGPDPVQLKDRTRHDLVFQ
jgi:hypothetical protein